MAERHFVELRPKDRLLLKIDEAICAHCVVFDPSTGSIRIEPIGQVNVALTELRGRAVTPGAVLQIEVFIFDAGQSEAALAECGVLMAALEAGRAVVVCVYDEVDADQAADFLCGQRRRLGAEHGVH